MNLQAILEKLGGINQAIFAVIEILHQILLELAWNLKWLGYSREQGQCEMLGGFLWASFFCFISKHLKMGLPNGILRATLGLSRLSMMSVTQSLPIWRGFFFSKYAPFLHSLKNATKLERHLCPLHVRLLLSTNYQQSCLVLEEVPSSLFLPSLKTISSLIKCVWKGCVGHISLSFVCLWLPLSWLIPELENHSGWGSVGALPLGLGRAK